MDKVFIRGLKVDAVIGVYDWEKQVRQPLIFDLEMAWDIRLAAATDDLMHALNYQAVTEFIERFVREQHFQLHCWSVWLRRCAKSLVCPGWAFR